MHVGLVWCVAVCIFWYADFGIFLRAKTHIKYLKCPFCLRVCDRVTWVTESLAFVRSTASALSGGLATSFCFLDGGLTTWTENKKTNVTTNIKRIYLSRFEFAIMNSSCSGMARISIQTGEKTRHTHHQFTAKLCWGSLESWISSSNRRNLRIVASVKQTNLKPISNPVYLMVAKTPYFEHRRAATVVMHCPWQNKEQTCVANAMVPFHCQNHHHHLLARQHKQVSASSPRPYRGTSGCQTTP